MAVTTLSAAITSAGAATFSVVSATGFPPVTTASGNYFYCTLLDGAQIAEHVKVTDITGLVFTCVRAQDNSTARTFASGASVSIRNIAAVMAEFATIVDAAADATSKADAAQAAAIASANAHADALVVGLWDDRGSFNASVNTYPTTGGSGTAGAILKGDIWTISVVATSGVLLGYAVGTNVRAVVDTPGQTGANWAVTEVGLGYVPENATNKRTSFQATPDDTHYASEKLVKDSLDAKVAGNGAITPATKTKLTYDAKGLVISGTDATTADIADSANKRYVTDAQSTVLGNTSNTNTGDETTASISTKSAESPIRLNPREITANFAIASGYNAASVGPVTIADGVTVTVGDNATWSIH